MATLFPPAGPWVYDSTLPKPLGGTTDSVKKLLEFSSSDITTNATTATALNTLYSLLVTFGIIDSLDNVDNKFTILAPNSAAFALYNSTFSGLPDSQKKKDFKVSCRFRKV